MKTGLLNKDNEFIELPYYEIGTYAEEICKEYIEASEENKIKFEIFSENYSFFKPYLDFILFELDYKMINPMLHQDSMWRVEDGKLLLKSASRDRICPSVDDSMLGISYINPEDVQTCMIDGNGRVYKTNDVLNIYHEDVCDAVLNQYFIYDKELYETYEEYVGLGVSDSISFARNMLGFSQLAMHPEHSGDVVYCESFYNTYIDNVFRRIKELNPEFSLNAYSVHTKESLESAHRCIERISEMNENRRLRL